jgi:peptide/nickel transport system substrate-binding protein
MSIGATLCAPKSESLRTINRLGKTRLQVVFGMTFAESSGRGTFLEAVMKRREFLKSASALAASTAITAPAVFSPAKAQSRAETLLIVSESGPNNLDIQGVGTNVPGY